MIPNLTHQQIVILNILRASECDGLVLRDASKKFLEQSSQGFYMAMQRLENMGFIKSRFENTDRSGLVRRQRIYALETKGREELEVAREFYKRLLGAPKGELAKVV